MIHRRGVLPVLVMLVVVVAGVVLAIVDGPAGSSSDAPPTVTPSPDSAGERAVLRTLSAVERAYAAGDVRRLCRPGALLDGAVVRAENSRAHGCEDELESLMANVPRLHVTVRALALQPDLATADVVSTFGSEATVDFVRRGKRWLMSFSSGQYPIPALAGTSS
jgi:hypothetical protein